jgi:exopolyphosphatase / guanosine-5'-triphosphate,3'-diphosphate pyrophosphatase
MLCACIDIGTNTTRVLVADTDGGGVAEVLQQRAFTRIGTVPEIPRAKIAEVAEVVARQRALAAELGADPVRVIATAAIRGAVNREEFCAAMGCEVTVLDGEEEARLAFLGATRTFPGALPGRVAVVDVGGGSTEIGVGTAAGGMEWSRSFPVGSALLAHHGDPPTTAELDGIRAAAQAGLAHGGAPPPVDCAVAVGGSAASLPRLVGRVLKPAPLERALRVLREAPAAEVARQFALDPERVRLLPAGILILEAAGARLGRPLQIGRGGLREGVLLDLAHRV